MCHWTRTTKGADHVAPRAFIVGLFVVLAQRDPQMVDEFAAERAVRVTGALLVVLEEGSVGDKVPIASSAKVVVAGCPFVLQKRLVTAKPARAAVAICHGARDETTR